MTTLGDRVNRMLRGWQHLERRAKSEVQVIDFDVAPGAQATSFGSRWEVLQASEHLLERTAQAGQQALHDRLIAHLTYLQAILGARLPFADYVGRTQHLPVQLYRPSYIARRCRQLQRVLAEHGIDADGPVAARLARADRRLPARDLEPYLRTQSARYFQGLKDVIGRSLTVRLDVEMVDVPEYWRYWVDGSRRRFRLRFNGRRTSLTKAEAVQFLFHEVIAHCGQIASFRALIDQHALPPMAGITTVHTPEQFLFEGLAQTLPLFFAPRADESPLWLPRVREAHVRALVWHNIHVMINEGESIEACVRYGRDHLQGVPDAAIAAQLASRSANVLYRTYQYVYGVSFDYFLRLAERLDDEEKRQLLRYCYAAPAGARDVIQRFGPIKFE